MVSTVGQTYVLLVDDDDGLRKAVRRVIEQSGVWRVLDFGDGPSALAAMQGQPPCLAVLDLDMAPMNGVELAGELRARFADVPIVFLTGSRLEPWRAQLEQIGPRFVLRKPAAMADLLRVIADVCRPSSRGTDA